MEQKTYQVVSPVALVAVMVAFLSALFMANATPSQAAPGKHKTAGVTKSAVEHTESRIVKLRSAIKITEAQVPLWDEVTLVMRENAKSMDAMSKARAESAKTMNAVERIKFHSQITEAQLEQQKKFIPPFEALYASMSDEQKATTDTIFLTGRHGKHGKHIIN
jgi:periplasmic protein CpxP/Spy